MDMINSTPQPWHSTIDDFLEFAIAASTNSQFDEEQTTSFETDLNTTASSTQASSFVSRSRMSSTSSWSPSDSQSPMLDSPHADQTPQSGFRMQLVWPAETQSTLTSRPALSDQHHEKSCPRCRLTEAEARKCRLERRREQNRESQRKFRARKEAKIRESAGQVAALESYVQFLEQHNSELESYNAELQQQIAAAQRRGPDNTFVMTNSAKTELQIGSMEVWNPELHSLAKQPSNGSPDPLNHGPHLSISHQELSPAYYS